ncbi:MAG: Uma2 family endonuclease [Planctomycetaceae bacterium]
MSTIFVPSGYEQVLADLDQLELPETDGVPLDSPWHRDNINLLADSLKHQWRHRPDFFVGGNMSVFYSVKQARNRDFLGPDVFVVNGGVDRHAPRKVWTIWQENNRGLDVVIELLSPSTADHDRTDKKDLYEQRLRTPEYFCYDPETQVLEGWRLDNRHCYQPMERSEDGRLWSEELELWLGTWTGEYSQTFGTWLRWFDHHGNVCLLEAEDEARRADDEARRADDEARRADLAEAEVRRLRELLNAQGTLNS